MEVILLERVEKLGQMGDVVKVKPGFARNYLLPREKALRATDANKKRFESQRAQLEAENLKLREEADAVAKKMEGLSVILIRQAGEAGQLYGSVNARDIAAEITAAGFTVARSQVNLVHPIKTLGLFDLSVSLHPEVTVTVTANVARTTEEAHTQAETGKAVVGEEEDETPYEMEAVFDPNAEEGEAEEGEAASADAGEEETAE
ncbi:50S ribosomal protein L9 [Magnetovibrio sp.]|uniref:50S ribosomal protein L9 n=1 Tax=Magnetovibrio sp. TaxID=2024836 RepID=UPI002F933B31